MGGKWIKQIPEFIYIIDYGKEGGWNEGPFVHPPKGKHKNVRKFKLIEVFDEEKNNS